MVHTPDHDPSCPIAVVADDSQALVDTMTAALEAVGVEALGVSSADALESRVLECARRGMAPAIVITDIYMNGRTGLDASARLLRELPDLLIIVVSAFASEQVRARAERIGVRRVLSKPVGMRELQRAGLAELA